MGHMAGVAALAAVAAAWTGAAEAQASEVVARWTFNGSSGTTVPAEGSGTISLVGGTSQSFPAGTPTDKFAEDQALNKSLSIGSFASAAVGSGTRGVMFQMTPPAGAGVTITWSQRHSSSSSRWMRFEYTLDGTNFTSAGVANDGLLEASSGADVWMNDRSVDLSKVSGVAGNPNFAFRIMSVFAPGTETYAPASSTATYSSLGSIRFDLVTVSATHLPGPGTASLLCAAALSMGRRSRPGCRTG